MQDTAAPDGMRLCMVTAMQMSQLEQDGGGIGGQTNGQRAPTIWTEPKVGLTVNSARDNGQWRRHLVAVI